MSKGQSSTRQSPISGVVSEKTFNVNYHSKAEGKWYTGMFTAKRPTIMQSMQIEGIKSTILGGKYYDPRNPGCGVSPEMSAMAEMMAFLQVTVTQSPDWWEGGVGDFSDPDLLYEIFYQAQEVDPFRERFDVPPASRAPEESESDVEQGRGDGDPERERAGSDGGLAEMVRS